METKVSLALVGAFVLVLSSAIVAAVLWIASGRTARKEYDPYLAYFRESVSGLNVRAPVKYKGVEVGYVQAIGLDPLDPERVRLDLAIERGVPIRKDTVASLSVQGLTGIAFLDLAGGSREAPPLEAMEPEGLPVISTLPSLFHRLDVSSSALMAELSQTAQSVGALLDAETRASLQQTIRDLSAVARIVAARSDAIDTSLADAARALSHGARASERLEELVQQVGSSAAAVERASAEVARAGASARRALEGVERFGTGTLPEVEALVGDARRLTASLARLADELERTPNALVMGRTPPRLGPGE